jgi:hypothetical protein
MLLLLYHVYGLMILTVTKKKHHMRALKPFHSIVERFPTFRSKSEEKQQPFAPKRTYVNNEHDFIGEVEQPPHELDRVHYLLAGSIDMLDQVPGNEPLTAAQRANVKRVIIEDAQDLAARVLPAPVVDLLELQPKNPEDIASFHIDEPTELRTLFLLIHAYDVTNDPKNDEQNDRPLKSACEYIIKELTPRNAEILQEAYRRGAESGKPIIDQFRQLSALIDSELHDDSSDTQETDLDDKLHLLEVEPGDPDSTRAVGIAAMKATDGRDMDPFVKLYLKDIAQKQRATRRQHTSHSSKQ